MLYLAIDQHKSQLTVNVRGEDGTAILKRQVSTEWEKVRAFFADLAEKARPDGGFLAILEVCGMNPWLLEMLKEYGCREIVVIQPTERSKQKTDRRDAGKLSHLLWVHRQQFLEGRHPLGLRRVQPPTPQEADDRQLTALRARLTKKRTAVLNGIHKILRKHNLEQERPTKLFQTQSGEATQRLGSITKQGSKMVRYLLGQAVVKVGRKQIDFRDGVDSPLGRANPCGSTPARTVPWTWSLGQACS
jgi:hypothetical protein